MSPEARRQLERIRQRFRNEKADEDEAILLLREAASLAKTQEGLRDAVDLAKTREMREFLTDPGWAAYQMHLASWLDALCDYKGERYCFDSPLTQLYWALTAAQDQDQRAWQVSVPC